MGTGRVVAWVVVLALASASVEAWADPVDALLDGVDTVPSAAQWRRLGAAGGERLAVVAGDESVPLGRRARAVAGLVYFPTRATRRFLTRLLADEGSPSLLRRKAALGLARAFGDASVTALAAQAGAADPRLRDDVARALAAIGSARARVVLERRLAIETTWVRRTVARALGAAP